MLKVLTNSETPTSLVTLINKNNLLFLSLLYMKTLLAREREEKR